MERLRLVLRNQKLRLLLKSLFLGLGVFAVKEYGHQWLSVLFVAVCVIFYLRPNINLGKSWALYFLNVIFVFIFPWSSDLLVQALVSLMFAAVFGVILGVKNIIFLKRDASYYLAYFIMLGYLNIVFFTGALGSYAQVMAAISIFVIAREFYSLALKDNSLIYPAIAALIYSQLLWAIGILPISFVSKSILSILLVFLSEDIIINHINHSLLPKMVWRSAILFAALFIVILKLSGYQLS